MMHPSKTIFAKQTYSTPSSLISNLPYYLNITSR